MCIRDSRAVGQALKGVHPQGPTPYLDQLRERQAAVQELMELEVGRARGTIDVQLARERMAAVSARLADLNRASSTTRTP